MLLRSNFSSFPQYFNIPLISGVKLHIYLWNKVVWFIYLFPQFCKSGISRYGYLEVFERVPRTSRRKLLLRSNFSSFPQYFNVPLISGVKLHIYLWNMVVRFIFFLNSANLVYRGTDISKYFKESLGLRDNEIRIYKKVRRLKWVPTIYVLWRHKKNNIYPDTAFISSYIITKTCLYNIDPLKPHFYTVKLGFTGVYTIIHISAQNIDCGYSLEPPRRGGSNEYPQSMFWAEIWKISDFFTWKFSVFGDEILYIFV